MKKNTILHKIGQLIVPLKRTMSPLEADSHSACGGHFFNRSLLLLLMMTVGVSEMWGAFAEGLYYIKSNQKTEYYLCPSIGCYYGNNVDQPHLTTFKTEGDQYSIWKIVPVEGETDTYYIIHYKTGRYLKSNENFTTVEKGATKNNRKAVHLEVKPETLTDDFKFLIKNNSSPYQIYPKVYWNTDVANMSFNPTNEHQDCYAPADGAVKDGGAKGMIGLYSKTDNFSKWQIPSVASAPCATPIIKYDGDNINISYPYSDETGITIYYTTDGSDPSTGTSNASTNFNISASGVIKVRAIATKTGLVNSDEAVLWGSARPFLIQSKECADYYVVPAGNGTNINTSSLPGTSMQWTLQNAGTSTGGVQYYYVVNSNNKKINYNSSDYTLTLNEESADANKFCVFENGYGTGDYFLIPVSQTDRVLYKDKGNVEANNCYAGLNKKWDTNLDQWNLIACNETADQKNLFSTAPFSVSNDDETHFYHIASVGQEGYYIVPPAEADGYATTSNTDYDDTPWLFKVAASDNWLTYYYIINAASGKYMYFNPSNNQTADQSNVISLKEISEKNAENEEKFQFIMVRSTTTGACYIVPKGYSYADASHKNFHNNKYFGLWANESGPLKSTWSRITTGNHVKWTFSEAAITNLYLNPVFSQDESGNITITHPTAACDIHYTIDGMEPSTSSAVYDNTNGLSSTEQCRIKAIAKLKTNSSIVSDVVTLLNKPDITVEDITYNGTAQEPRVTKVSIGENGSETEAPSTAYSASYSGDNINAGTDAATVTLTDADATDLWYIWNASTTFTITAAEITVSGITASKKLYDGNTTATLVYTNVSFSGKVDGDNLTITATGAFEDKNVGTGKTVNITGLTLGGSDASNYTLAESGQQTTATASITAKEITVSGITAADKEYDGNTSATLDCDAAILTGMVENDDLTVTATGAFEDKNVDTDKTVTISNLTLGGADAGNYALAESNQQATATADITAKEITASGNITSSNKEYDGNTTATLDLANVTLTGIVEGDNVTVTAIGTYVDKNVGTGKDVTINLSLSGNDAGNYNLESSNIPTSITADITVKEVTASGVITANNKAYDGTTDAELVYTGVTLTGKVEGDDLTVTATGTFADKNVGTGKTVDISEWVLDGTDKDNYQLASSGQPTTTTADITVASITVSGITASNKIYDGNTTATLDFANVTFAGKVDNEDISVTATGAFADKNVGTDKNVSISDMSLLGDDIGNYVLAESGQQTTATASVTAKEITVSGFTSEDKEYDGTTTATLVYSGVTFSGMVEDDDLSVTATGAFADKNVGTGKTVTISEPTLGGEDAGNYALAEFGQQTTATASITAKGITVSGITAADRVYDGTTTATLVYTSATLAGMVEDDDLSVTATGAFADKNVDTDKTVNISGLTLSGYDAGNYVLAESGQQTEATANITPKSVTVSGVTAENKVYDGTTVATLVLEDARFAEGDIIEGDELTLESGIGAFDTKDVGTNKTVNLIFGGADAGNYALAASGQQDPITADITPAPLTITANDKSISYGDAPANDGVTFGVDDGNDGTTNTFVDGEDENVLGGTLTFSYNSQSDGLGTAYTATDIVPMGTCYIIPGGWTSTNYFITFVPGTLTIGGKSIGDGTLAAGFTISFDEDNNIILQDGSRTLTEGTDYSIDGTSTISASGRYSTRTINGTGNYGGTANIRNAIVNFTNDGNGGTVYSATFVAESATPDASPDPQKGHALPDGITAYIITAINGNTATTEALSYIPEGVPVLLLSNGDSNGFMVQDVSGQTAPTSTNLLKEVTEESKHFDVKTIYMLYRNEFVYNMAGDLSKGRVYLDPTPSSPSGARLVINWGEENSIDTSILSSLASPLPDTWHSLDGRRLNGKPTKKGLYIRNGQMVVIK